MILQRSIPPAILGGVLLAAATVACSHASGAAPAAKPSCPGEERLTVENNTRGEIEVYMYRPSQRNGIWLGIAQAGRSTMAVPADLPRNARFAARLPNGRGVDNSMASAVQFRVECPRP